MDVHLVRIFVQLTQILIKQSLPVEEKKMMGGLTFMVDEKMCVGIVKDDLMARIAPEEYEFALKKPGSRPMDFTGRPMPGFIFVSGIIYLFNCKMF